MDGNKPSGGLLQTAAMFKALGDPTRLRIFEFLCSCAGSVTVDERGDVRLVQGPTMGEICCHVTGLDHITSTVSFHLKELRLAGLLYVERRGKNMICTVNRDAARRLGNYLLEAEKGILNNDCCA